MQEIETRTPNNGVKRVEAVERALRILETLGQQDGRRGVTDIARHLDLHKSTVHRILATLESSGFVHQVPGGEYALSWKVAQLSRSVDISRIVKRGLAKLVDECGETAHLAVLVEGEVLYVEKVESRRALRMPSAVGKRVAVHCTALGKALSAALSETERLELLASLDFEPHTPATIRDRKAFEVELLQAREQGYTVDREEIEAGLMCIAAPIRTEEGSSGAAISVAGPRARIEPVESATARMVQSTAEALMEQLGPLAGQLRTYYVGAR